MLRLAVPLVVLLGSIGAFASAGELPRVEPKAVGLSAEKLATLKPTLQKIVDDGKIAGGVALIARHGQVAYLDSFGYRDIASKAPMTEDTIFAIASMTKPITCVALMTLVEAGKVGLDDPLAKYIPEMENLRVIGEAKDGTADVVATVPTRRQVTIRDLLSHSSGFSYGSFLSANPRVGKAYDRAGVQDRTLKTLEDQMKRLAKVPLAHQPGEGWTYGLSHDILGRVVEVASGRRFDEYLKERIFQPLDMPDTAFSVPEAKRSRVATIYRGELLGNKLTPLPRTFGSETLFSGGGGLFSTARDYSRFAQMLCNGGELGGVRIIKAETLALMTTNQIGKNNAFGLFKYGLGFGLEMSPGEGDKAELNRYFWSGLFSTNFWIEPKNDVVAVILTQVLPTNNGGPERVLRRVINEAILK